MFYTDPTGKRVSRDQAMIGGHRRAGFNAIYEDSERARMRPGDYLGFDISMVDSAPARSPVFLTDSKPSGEQGVEAARRQWMADKSSAYRGNRTVAAPASSRQGPIEIRVYAEEGSMFVLRRAGRTPVERNQR